MYSGSTLTPLSGRLLGAHQKFDRVAYYRLRQLLPEGHFPLLKSILHFEGKNGPDAIKRKSPARDEPWHYFNPSDKSDTHLLELIREHYGLLAKALAKGDDIKAAFEAAWLAHAMVDGLTPAHHYPYEEKLVELRGGQPIETRDTIRKKLLLPGDDRRTKLRNNWLMWGARGIFTTHALFELGVATLIAPLGLKKALPTSFDIAEFTQLGLETWFRQTAQEVASWKLYEKFYKTGWTPWLALRIRNRLAPTIAKAVTLAWYGAAQEAGHRTAKPKSKR